MKFLLFRSFSVLALLPGLGCTPATSSSMKGGDGFPPANLFENRSLSADEVEKAAATFGFSTSAKPGSYTSGACTSCHTQFATAEGLQSLASQTDRVKDCLGLKVKTPEGSRELLSCLAKLRGGPYDSKTGEPVVSSMVFTTNQIRDALLQVKPKDLGIFAAAIGHSEFARIFHDAEMDDAYPSFRDSVRMPYRGSLLPDVETENLVLWFTTGLPNFANYIKHEGPDVCRTPADTFIGSKVKEHVLRMSQEGEGWEFINVARGMPMFACTGMDKNDCFQQKVDNRDIFPTQEDWLNPGVAGTLRKLHSYEDSTNYWIRSSADGRYVANGGSSAIIDLQPKLAGSTVKSISIKADFDPSFTPDNQAFLFQGEHGTRICSQSLLQTTDLTTIDFMNVGCSTSDLQVGLYQGLGSSLDNGDIITINGDFQSDSGSDVFQNVTPLFSEKSSITVSTIRRADATAFEKVSSFTVPTPYHASWMASPSRLLNAAVVSAATDHKARHGGYRLVLSNQIQAGSNLPAFDDPSTAMLCVGTGEKPNFSFDERLLAYYAYEVHPEFVKVFESSSDIYVIDLLGTGKPVQITKMPKGFYAQFPHFRSDGWLYFSVFDANSQQRHIMATDAGILLSR
jgi:hypothetical protein